MNPSSRLGWRHAGDPAVLLACGLGSGFLPRAPGTWGSLLAVLLWWLFFVDSSLLVQLSAIVVLFVAGTLLIARVQQTHKVTDDGALVIDEVVGQWLVLIGIGTVVPEGDSATMLLYLAAGFGLFRLFDIWKPWPIRTVERKVAGALGVMLDDVIAGLLGLTVLQITIWLLTNL